MASRSTFIPNPADPEIRLCFWFCCRDLPHAARQLPLLTVSKPQRPGPAPADYLSHARSVVLYAFEEYLKGTFPGVFEALHLEHFATHGLLLTWRGSDASLAPIVLMAHQDTVPVPLETVARWTHPPFEGHVDEQGWVWGRGAADCKNLWGLSAVSELLSAGFKPARTVLLAFGFDEEGGAVHSARAIASHLEDVYERDSVLMILDKGGGGIGGYSGRTWIAPAMPNPFLVICTILVSNRNAHCCMVLPRAEKGIVNIELSINVPGGHSSVPAAHTN
ncbi:hypothetical protein C8R43DRAFT_1112467 [Mycena crocata]|nr:hypothetical protein C8R43DRAFT_1112467 [Mycena crocata]